MRVLKMALIVSTLVGAAACSGDAKPAAPAASGTGWAGTSFRELLEQ